jgi:UDP-N-acetylglucosamine 2-epimerase
MKKISLIIGARPNFMKAFPVYEALKEDFELTLIHSGQHFDAKMSDVFFNQLKFPHPDIHLTLEKKTKSGDFDDKLYVNNADYLKDKDAVIEELMNYNGDLGQLGEIRDKLKVEFEKIQPDLVIVFGDVTSTLAAGLAAKMLNVELAHVESGLRSGDMLMPEEVNRVLTDHITKYYFVTEKSGVDNLNEIGITENVYLVGNTMIDTQKKYLQQALDTKYHETLGVKSKEYVLITLHRPSNVDNMDKLKEIFDDFEELSKTETLVYPIHPRTKNNLEKLGYLQKVQENPNIILDEPLGYLEFTCLMAQCKYVVTDSGGLQEESTSLDIPCFTLRENTERPSTLIENNGTNQMIHKISEIELKECKSSMDLWDGNAAIYINYQIKILFRTISYNNQITTHNYINMDTFDFNLLLGRKPININNIDSYNFLQNKKILITGGCGSIGSEIVRQLLYLGINNLHIVDNGECSTFNLFNEIRKLFPSNVVKFYLRDITNNKRMNDIFDIIKPEIVFHAAAYKHVPIMEENPHEAININIIGTKVLADLAIQYNVEKFVFISTDKAVNPTNIMGASKRVSELYIHHVNKFSKSEFVITRFGNVLGSSGSVIPTFIKNINENRNLQITHKDITRYFMSIPEAAQLVIKAITIGKGGQILLFDMGDSVKIIDLARNLLNIIPNKNIFIDITGLRPGEKLYEELLCKEEEIIPTSEEKIMILNRNEEIENFIDKYNNIIENYLNMNILTLKKNIKSIVNEYTYK